jgi:thymidylate synthase (FAD)
MFESINNIAGAYLKLADMGVKPDSLRALLPLWCKADMVFSGSIREWRSVLKLRLSKAAHPDVRKVMGILLDKFMEVAPELFEDIYYEN